MRQHRACPLGSHERRSGSRALPLGDCEPRRDRQQDRGHDVVRRRRVVDERARQGKLRLCRGEVAALQREERPLGARDHAGPGRSSGDGRVRSLDPGWPPLGRHPPRTAPPSRAGRRRRGTTGSWRAGETTRARRRSASARRRSLQSKARTVAAQASRGLPSGIGSSDWAVSTASAQRSAASGRPRNACTHTPSTATRDTARAGRDRRSARASARPWSHGRCGSTVPRARRRAWRPHRCRRPRPSTRSPPPAGRSPCTTRPLCD